MSRPSEALDAPRASAPLTLLVFKIDLCINMSVLAVYGGGLPLPSTGDLISECPSVRPSTFQGYGLGLPVAGILAGDLCRFLRLRMPLPTPTQQDG